MNESGSQVESFEEEKSEIKESRDLAPLTKQSENLQFGCGCIMLAVNVIKNFEFDYQKMVKFRLNKLSS
jgi:hypothetical protein